FVDGREEWSRGHVRLGWGRNGCTQCSETCSRTVVSGSRRAGRPGEVQRKNDNTHPPGERTPQRRSLRYRIAGFRDRAHVPKQAWPRPSSESEAFSAWLSCGSSERLRASVCSCQAPQGMAYGRALQTSPSNSMTCTASPTSTLPRSCSSTIKQLAS